MESIMGRYLNIGMMQTHSAMDFESCLGRIEKDVADLMADMNTPELIAGVEMAIGRYWQSDETKMGGDPIPGKVTERLSGIAKKYGVYLMPGSMIESAEKDGEKVIYNSIPIFGPDGSLIDVYRKMCPYYPVEGRFSMGERYVTFKIKEKDITVGVLNCHDVCFPEISRNLALLGAEILIKPSIDPEGLYEICRSLAPARALENQAYFISLNMAGEFLGSYAYGRSMVCGPDGRVLYEAGSAPTCLTMTFDFDKVRDARRYGTNYTDQFLRQLKLFNPPMPFANDIGGAPVYENLPEPDLNYKTRAELFKRDGLMTIGKPR